MEDECRNKRQSVTHTRRSRHISWIVKAWGRQGLLARHSQAYKLFRLSYTHRHINTYTRTHTQHRQSHVLILSFYSLAVITRDNNDDDDKSGRSSQCLGTCDGSNSGGDWDETNAFAVDTTHFVCRIRLAFVAPPVPPLLLALAFVVNVDKNRQSYVAYISVSILVDVY